MDVNAFYVSWLDILVKILIQICNKLCHAQMILLFLSNFSFFIKREEKTELIHNKPCDTMTKDLT